MTGLDPALFIQGDFILVRKALVDMLEGDHAAAIVMQRIMWRCERDGVWRATQQQIADECQMTLRTTQRKVAWLIEQGWLLSTREGRYDPTRTYRVNTDEADRQQWRSPTRQNGGLSDRQNGGHFLIDSKELKPLSEAAPQTLVFDEPAALAETDGFEEFWAAYPRKDAKRDAYKAWPAALKRGGGLAPLLAGVARMPLPDNRRMIPLPATWLRGERWLDEGPEKIRRVRNPI